MIKLCFLFNYLKKGDVEEDDSEDEYNSEDERIYREYMERLAQEEYAKQMQMQAAAEHRAAEESSDEDYEEQQHFANADGYEREQDYQPEQRHYSSSSYETD